MTNTTHSPANQIKKHNTNGYDNNRSSESFILHSPGAQNNSSIGQLVANLVSSKSSELNSSDSLITSKFHTIGHLAGSPNKADSHDKDTKNKPAIINNDFSDSSDSEIDYVNSSPKSKILDKNNKFNNSGKKLKLGFRKKIGFISFLIFLRIDWCSFRCCYCIRGWLDNTYDKSNHAN
jgi:hypothetical protein